MNYTRTADDGIYLAEDRYATPKESFKQIADILDLPGSSGTLVDIGCATGEFLSYARSLNPDLILRGVEYSAPLAARGNERLADQGIEILEGDANRLPLADSSCDIVTTIGVTSIFDDFRPSYAEAIRVARDGGVCLNHMLVNEEEMDVIVRYQHADGSLEAGWNRFSLKSIGAFLDAQSDVSTWTATKHEMPFDIPRREDAMRSWTKELNGKRVLWNGLGAEVSLYHIVFKVTKS